MVKKMVDEKRCPICTGDITELDYSDGGYELEADEEICELHGVRCSEEYTQDLTGLIPNGE